MKRPWFFGGLLAVVLALGIMGGALAGQRISVDADAGGIRQSFAARVAEILGRSEEEVRSAFTQAHREQQDARVQHHMDQLVTQEKIEPADATVILDWFTGRPDPAIYLRRALLVGEAAVERQLDRMLERGRISEDEANAVLDWFDGRPEVLSDLTSSRWHRDKPRFHNRFHQRGFGGGEFHHHDHRYHQPAPVPYQRHQDQTDF